MRRHWEIEMDEADYASDREDIAPDVHHTSRDRQSVDGTVAVGIPGGGEPRDGVDRGDMIPRLSPDRPKVSSRIDYSTGDRQRQDGAIRVRVPGGGEESADGAGDSGPVGHHSRVLLVPDCRVSERARHVGRERFYSPFGGNGAYWTNWERAGLLD